MDMMDKSTKTTPSAEELLRKIQELEKRHALLKQQLSKLIFFSSNSNSNQQGQGPSASASASAADPLATKLTQTQYFNIMQSVGQAIHVYDLSRRIIFWNRAAENLYGFTSAEAYGKTPTELLVEPKNTSIADYLLEQTVKGESWSGEFPVHNKRGDKFVVVATNTSYLDENRRLLGAICISSDTRPYQLMKPPRLGFHSRHTSIASKMSNLASKVKSKMKSGTAYDKGGRDVVTYYFREDTLEGEASTTRAHLMSPFGVFITEEHFTIGKEKSVWPWKGSEKQVEFYGPRLSTHGLQGNSFALAKLDECGNSYSGDDEIEASGLWFSSIHVSNTSTTSSSSSTSSGRNNKSNAVIKVEGESDRLDYEILWEDLITKEQIGQGSCGTVYHALWCGSDVAIKLFVCQEYSDDVILSFKQEVSLMKRLRHPNILLFMGAVTSPQHLCIVTEFLPRGSLYRILQRNTTGLDWRRRLHMAIDIARGMNYLHHCNPPIIHRDLKSSNLLVDKNWTVKVGDFGLSRIKLETYLRTKSGKGTPQWMAPEVLRNEQADEKSDVYSYGVVLWEIITEKIPWDNLNAMQVIGAVGFMNRRLEIPKDVDPLWASLIESCWNDPESRPTFQEILCKLKDLQKKYAIERRR